MDILEIIGNISSLEMTIRLIGAGLIVGSLLAFLAIRRRSRIVSGFLAAGALSRDGSKTLAEAGLKDSGLNRFSLRDGTVLSRYVVRTSRPDPDGAQPDDRGGKTKKPSKKADGTGRYYIPEDKKDEAEIRLVKKAPIYIWIVGALVLAAATEAAARIVPMLTSRF